MDPEYGTLVKLSPDHRVTHGFQHRGQFVGEGHMYTMRAWSDYISVADMDIRRYLGKKGHLEDVGDIPCTKTDESDGEGLDD